MSDRDVDAEFADIIARWDEVETLPDAPDATGDTSGTGTGAGDGDGDGTTAAAGSGTSSGADSADDSSHGGAGQTATGINPPLQPSVNPPPTRPFVVWRGAEQPGPAAPDAEQAPDPVELRDLRDVDDDDDEHFEPGPTAPLPPQEDLQFWGIIVGLVAGPLVLLWLVLFRPNVSDWWTLGALGLTFMGFVLLVLRQPHDRTEDDPDHGARV